jgi:hypothetical protein
VHRIAEALAEDLGDHPEMQRAEVVSSLVTAIYSDNHVEASRWILDSFSTHFPCDAPPAAA